MKILVYHGKYGDEYWLANTPEQKITALKRLFTFLDSMGCYEGEENLAQAREGNKAAIIGILNSRACCEYESWDIVEAIEA